MMGEEGFDKGVEVNSGEGGASFGRRALKGGAWIFAFKIVQRILSLSRTIILARLLSPDDFGLMGIAVLAINTLETFSKTGMEPALVQKKEEIKDYLDTAWSIRIIRSLVLFILLYLGAPFVARFFKSLPALNVIRMLALIVLFTGAGNIGSVCFQKELHFNKRAILEFSGLAANIVLSVTLAFVLRNVWALVYGSLLGALITCIMSYIMHPFRPCLKIDLNKARELLHFGKWLFGSSILVFLITQGDNVFVGRFLSVTALGFYQMAYNLSNAPATEISHVIAQVTFPVYSKIQGDIGRLRKAYLEVLQLNLSISLPLSAGIFILAEDFTRLFLGSKWLPMVLAMRTLAFAGLLRSVAATTGAVFYAIGKPKIDVFWQGVRLAVLVCCIYPLMKKWGIYGVSLAVCLSIAVATAGFIVSVLREMDAGMWDVIGPVMNPVFNTLLMAGVLVFFRCMLRTVDLFGFMGMVLTGAAVYAYAGYLCEKHTEYKIYTLIRERIKK